MEENSKYEVLLSIFETENTFDIINNLINPKISAYDVLYVISLPKYDLERDLNLKTSQVRNIVKAAWPNKPATSMKVCSYLLESYGFRYCPSCKIVKDFEDFFLQINLKEMG